MPSFEITPIGVVRNNRTDVDHTDNWGAVRSTITVDERFGEACLQGQEGFSHVEVLFAFDRFPVHDDVREPRPYRGRSDLPPVGIFAAAALAGRIGSGWRAASSSPLTAATWRWWVWTRSPPPRSSI